MGKRYIINSGDVFGKLTVIREIDKIVYVNKTTKRMFLCYCECGGLKEVSGISLMHNYTTTCGCIVSKWKGESTTRIYSVWNRMRSRCKPTEKQSKNYFEKGINVCEEWEDYYSFKNWALSNGYEQGLTIDRKDNNKGYSPDNCRFITKKENTNNREITVFVEYEGVKILLTELLMKLGLSDQYMRIRARLRNGWDLKKALYEPKIQYKN